MICCIIIYIIYIYDYIWLYMILCCPHTGHTTLRRWQLLVRHGDVALQPQGIYQAPWSFLSEGDWMGWGGVFDIVWWFLDISGLYLRMLAASCDAGCQTSTKHVEMWAKWAVLFRWLWAKLPYLRFGFKLSRWVSSGFGIWPYHWISNCES